MFLNGLARVFRTAWRVFAISPGKHKAEKTVVRRKGPLIEPYEQEERHTEKSHKEEEKFTHTKEILGKKQGHVKGAEFMPAL